MCFTILLSTRPPFRNFGMGLGLKLTSPARSAGVRLLGGAVYETLVTYFERGLKMTRDNTKACIIAHYSNHCFCDKPVLPPGTPVSYRPRFNFHKAAQQYADRHGLDVFAWNKTHKQASCVSRFCCQHGHPSVTLEWGLALS